MLWFIIAALAAYYFYKYVIKPQSYWTNLHVKQTKWVIPIFGDVWGGVIRQEAFADIIKRLYFEFPNERYFGTQNMCTPVLVVRDPDLIKQMTVKDFEFFPNHITWLPENCDPVWEKNLIALKDEKWRDMRSTLSPAFTSSKMKAMFNLINATGDQFVSYYENKNEKILELDMKDCFLRVANDVIATCALGITCDSLKNRENEFFLMAKETTNLSKFWRNLAIYIHILMPRISEILKISFFTETIRNFYYGIVSDMLRIRQEQNIHRPDMIHLLMEARKGRLRHDKKETKDSGFATTSESSFGKIIKTQLEEITDADITAQVMIFFSAGFETTATVMSFLAYELAINPDIQDKLRMEIDETLEDQTLTYDVLFKMKYLDMVVSETLRRWPTLPAADRVCVKDYVIKPTRPGERPLHIKKGDVIWFPVVGIQRDPKYYPEPYRFDPERFNDENKHKINQYTYFPFGLGPRNCVGSRFALMELKIMFVKLLSKFEIVVVDKTPIPMTMDKTQFAVSSEHGFWLGLKKRTSIANIS